MSPVYNNEMFESLSALREDLNAGKLNERQFNFLLGVLLQKEVNTFTKWKIKEVMPTEKAEKSSMTFIRYIRNRQFNHAK